MAILNGKKAIIIGDRDGIPGQAIAECAKSAEQMLFFHLLNALSERPQELWTLKIKGV